MPRWRLKDLVAYECALARDRTEEWNVLKERDARLGQAEGARDGKARRGILFRWLQARLREDSGIRTAAESVNQSLSVAGQLLAGVGCVLGLGAAAGSLAYTGAAPINVSAFFSIFILLQMLLALVLLMAFFLPARGRDWLAFGPLFRCGRWAFQALFAWAQTLAGRFLSGQQRQEAAEIAAMTRQAVSLHGSLFKWVAFTKIQAAALLFNLGALAALLFAVLFSDRAFGWQTTLQVSGETVHQLVQWVALPWSGFYGEGLGYPDLEQVRGSRIVLKEGLQTLENRDLASWWRFLALGILFYGILPRILFYGLGKIRLRSALARVDFRNAASERLMQRLVPPGSLFVAEKVQQESAEAAPDELELDHPLVETGPGIRCLYSAELADSVDKDALRAALARLWRQDPAFVKLLVYRDGRMHALAGELREHEQAAVLFESWMPPIKEQERQLRTLRKALGKQVLIKIVLLGIPMEDEESVSLRPERQYRDAWHAFVNRLGDPYLMLEDQAT